MPRISVVMTAHNSASFLAVAAQSILDQTVSDLELIIVDDASTDETADVAHQLSDGRVKFLVNASRLGPAGAANRGVSAAQGEFLARMDSDDVARPHRFARQLERFAAEPGLAVLGCDVREIDALGRRGKRRAMPASRDRVAFASLYRNPVMHPTAMLRRRALASDEPYREDLHFAEDYALMLPFARERRVANLSEVLLDYRVHPGSVTARVRGEMLASTRDCMHEQFHAAGFAPLLADPVVTRLFEAIYRRVPLDRTSLDGLFDAFRAAALAHAPDEAEAILGDLRFSLLKAAVAGRSVAGLATLLAASGTALVPLARRSAAEFARRMV